MRAKGGRREHLELRAEFHDLNDALAIIRARDLEHVAAIFLDAMALIGDASAGRRPSGRLSA